MDSIYTWLPIEVPVIEINSLTEFIDKINDLSSKKYYFRGESSFYGTRTASVYRPFKSDDKPIGFSNNFISFKDLISEYYLQVGSIIDSAEKENFIAYSQHHGLFTPLLDVSMNGLVALFFAAQKNFKQPGYVYLFEKENSIDISKFLRGTEWTDILTKLVEFDDFDFIRTITYGLIDIIEKNPLEYFTYEYSLGQHMKHLREQSSIGLVDYDYLEASESIVSLDYPGLESDITMSYLYDNYKYEYSLNSFVQHDSMKDKFNKFYSAIKDTKSAVLVEQDKDSDIFDVAVYLFTLRTHLTQLHSRDVAAYDFHNLPSFPQLIYKPTHLFDRMKAQDGVFFYQLGLHKTESVYDAGSIEMQQYLPTYILKINDKERILNDLDNIGISLMSLFPDVDNIANYLNSQYSK